MRSWQVDKAAYRLTTLPTRPPGSLHGASHGPLPPELTELTAAMQRQLEQLTRAIDELKDVRGRPGVQALMIQGATNSVVKVAAPLCRARSLAAESCTAHTYKQRSGRKAGMLCSALHA